MRRGCLPETHSTPTRSLFACILKEKTCLKAQALDQPQGGWNPPSDWLSSLILPSSRRLLQYLHSVGMYSIWEILVDSLNGSNSYYWKHAAVFGHSTHHSKEYSQLLHTCRVQRQSVREDCTAVLRIICADAGCMGKFTPFSSSQPTHLLLLCVQPPFQPSPQTTMTCTNTSRA